MLLSTLYAALALNNPAMRRSDVIKAASGILLPNLIPAPASAAVRKSTASAGPTNEVMGVVDGIRQKRLGGSGIIVSEVGLGTQRWGSTDYNAPDQAACHAFMDKAILESGVNLIDTAEQYPIPSDEFRPEGYTEQIIGAWLKQDPARRRQVVITSKITGADNINRRNIMADCEASLRRLGTDYLDVYLLHWPARYTPQANWGQSLEFNPAVQELLGPSASFAEVAEAMGKLVQQGKIRGWGMANDNAYGLAASVYTARALGVAPPCVLQNGARPPIGLALPSTEIRFTDLHSPICSRPSAHPWRTSLAHRRSIRFQSAHDDLIDYSLINRRIEENGVSEASSPMLENVGFMAYDVLAGGVLTGKYVKQPRRRPCLLRLL